MLTALASMLLVTRSSMSSTNPRPQPPTDEPGRHRIRHAFDPDEGDGNIVAILVTGWVWDKAMSVLVSKTDDLAVSNHVPSS
jgi:hypothetical protein